MYFIQVNEILNLKFKCGTNPKTKATHLKDRRGSNNTHCPFYKLGHANINIPILWDHKLPDNPVTQGSSRKNDTQK